MLLAVTPGDPDGIGPEVVAKTLLLQRKLFPRDLNILGIGAAGPFRKLGVPLVELSDFNSLSHLPRTRPGELLFISAPEGPQRPNGGGPKKSFSLQGFQSGWAIERATRLALSGKVDAIVTGPISKSRLQAGGYFFPGHTEMLASLCRKKKVTMMLANEHLRVALVTTHVSLNRLSKEIRSSEISRAIEHTIRALREWWGIGRPRLAVCALNPHAGEGGAFGNEEIRVISPTLRRLQKRYAGAATIDGPLPADTLFAKNALSSQKDRYDAIISMYHDQGLIPVKLLDFAGTVNVTLGLPIVRTSVDHGVAFDIAGTGKADPTSFQSALRLAYRISAIRHQEAKK